MMINIRGTSGSGKTTIVKNLIAMSNTSVDVFEEGRKQPLYSCHKIGGLQYATLGHYNTACGGCDTLPSLDSVFALYERIKDQFDFVIAEGKILGDDTKRTPLVDNVVILYLTTPIEECYEGVKQRRIAKGQLDKSLLKPKKLEKDAKTIASATNRLRDKVRVIDVARWTAIDVILNEIIQKK